MTSSIQPPADGPDELDEFLRDDRSPSGPAQTDLEPFTGPADQPADASKAAVESRRPAKASNNKSKQKNEKKQKLSSGQAESRHANGGRSGEEAQHAGPSNQPAELEARHVHQAIAAADPSDDDAPGVSAPPSVVIGTASASNLAPRPLGLMLSPAAMPPVQALGSRLATVAAAVQRVVQAPMSIIVSTLLALLAVIAQGHVNVRLLHGSSKPVSLFLLTLGVSGLRKTTVDDFVSRGAKWAEAALLELQKEGDSSPLWQRIVRTGSFEGFLRKLKDGAGALGLLNDDAGSFLGGHAMSPENRMKTTAGLSQLWDGSAVNYALSDAERSINMSHRRLSVHLGIQPELMLPLLADGNFLNQGILARFLVTVPDSNIGYRPVRRPAQADLRIIDDFAHLVKGLLLLELPYRSDKSRALKPRALELSNGAFDAFADYANEVEFEQRPYRPYASLTGPASKFAENAIRIASVLAYFEDQTATEISEEQAKRATELMRFYAMEMVRLLSVKEQAPLLASANGVLKWLQDKWKQPTIRFQDFCQGGPVRTADGNRVIIPVLEQHGWLIRVSGDGYHGATNVWAIVPRPAESFAADGPFNIPTDRAPKC